MLVFSLSHVPSGRIFVTSSRLPMEERWQEIMEMAESGKQSLFLDLLREDGDDAFRLDEWGESDSAGEVRRLLDEAMEELGGEPLKLTPVTRKHPQKPTFDNDAFKKLMQEIESSDPDLEGDDEPPSDTSGKDANTDGHAQAVPSKDNQARRPIAEGPDPKLATAQKARPEADEVERQKESATARKRRINEALRQQREEHEQLRQTRSTREADEMRALILAIETRRQQQKKHPPKAKARKKAQAAKTSPTRASKAPAKSQAAGAPPRLAEGRASSSTREKRIREQLKLERERRDQEKLARIASEKDEMAEILARIDARAKKIPNRRR